MSTIKKIALGKGGPLVSKLGLGCMHMSPVWGSPKQDEAESIATIQAALDNGINFLNTGDFYASGHNELLVSKAIKGRRDDAFISVKFGGLVDGARFLGLDLRPISIRNFINYSLVRLGVDTIDLYQPCRLDNSVPVEDVIGTVADLINEGKVRYLGVSEITAAQLRKAHGIHPVTALEIGYSLAERTIEKELLPTAKELGIGVVAFANTSEGLLSGQMKAPLPAGDYRNHFSRFQGENLTKNLAKVEVLKAMAKDKGYTPVQLAIAWVNQQDDHIMSLVSMSRRSRLPENIAALEITFTPQEINTLNTTFAVGAIAGSTYLQR
jgi:aryl-alcohol dehydrogenase-like predicted oxidoreductase